MTGVLREQLWGLLNYQSTELDLKGKSAGGQ
ncbi:unnamed protein product, partial [marine sediment metagenome]